jgi:hypothetical protein
MSTQWRGVEIEGQQAEERVRVCMVHRRICTEDDRRDQVLCPSGHVVTTQGFGVMTRAKAEAIAPQGGLMTQGVRGSGPADKKGRVRSIVSEVFQDPAGWRLRISLRANKGRFEVFVFHLSPDKKKKQSGILASFETEQPTRDRYDVEVRKARAKQWQPVVSRRGGGGLKEIPDPQPAKASARGASERDRSLASHRAH